MPETMGRCSSRSGNASGETRIVNLSDGGTLTEREIIEMLKTLEWWKKKLQSLLPK